MAEEQYIFPEWIGLANDAIKKEIFDGLTDDEIGGWTENHVTTQILKEIARLGTEIRWIDFRQRIKWKAYKYTGTAETLFGDIAFFVRVNLGGGVYIDGVAYYEAKRQYFNASGVPSGYRSIKLEQIQEISNSTHASHVLLYDILTNKTGSAKAVPTQFVQKILEARKIAKGSMILDVSLRQYGLLWINRLGNNFLGFDLDFREEAINSVRDFIRARPGVSVINAGIAMNQFLEPDPAPFAAHNVGGYDKLDVPGMKDGDLPGPY